MLSFDPVYVTKSVIFNRLEYDSILEIRCKLSMNEIMNTLDLYLENTNLCFRKTFFCQNFGVAMGFLISFIVTNLVMEFIENKMQKILHSLLRYIDDTSVFLKKTLWHFFTSY